MSIKNFEQFINESAEVNKERLSINDIINDAYTKLIETSKNVFENNIKKLTLQFPYIDNAINLAIERYGDIFVGDPDISISSPKYGNNMDEIVIYFNTNVPSIEYKNYEDDVNEFNKKFENIGEEFYFKASKHNIDIYNNKFEINAGFYDGEHDDDPLYFKMFINGIYSDYLVDFCKKNYCIDELIDQLKNI